MTVCGQRLKRNMNLENVVKTFILEDTYSAEGLKAALKSIENSFHHN